jgi:site-specific recombinase XerD
VADPKRPAAGRYTADGYPNAIRRAVSRANRDRRRRSAADGTPFVPIPRWHPNQLRHAFATTVRREYGLEAAQVLLGHSKCDTTQVYAERTEALAVTVAGEVG